MRALLTPVADFCRELWQATKVGWDRFWFTPVVPTTLGAVRFCTGMVMLYAYATCAGELLHFLGPNAWMDQQAIDEIRAYPWYHAQSIYFYVQHPTAIMVLYGIFLVACFTFMIGFCSRISNLIVWIGHISYIYRGAMIWFGMDSILAMLLLYLLFGPTGAALSVDRLIQRYRQGKLRLAAGRTEADPPAPSWGANVVLRMIQVHMCVVYLCAGLAKLQGGSWWSGTAVWMTMVSHEFVMADFTWLATSSPWPALIVSSIGVAFTLFFEISFPFLIWHRMWRPILLFMAVLLHLGIGVIMGLGAFGAAMLTGCLAFVGPGAVQRFLALVFQGRPAGRFYFNRHERQSVRQAAWISAADSWGQVELVEAHGKTAALAGTLHPPEGGTLGSTSAFWRLVRALRTMWVFWPLALWSFARANQLAISPQEAARPGEQVPAGR